MQARLGQAAAADEALTRVLLAHDLPFCLLSSPLSQVKSVGSTKSYR